ncbi:MAG: Yellowstone lake phycodnavirus 2 [Bacteroidota bacterium]|jgi:ATP-dependent protease ClpP protease subunit
MSYFGDRSTRWVRCGPSSKKRKVQEVELADEEDEDTSTIPFIFPKPGSQNVYSTFNHVYFNDDITYETMFALNKELRMVESKLKTTATALGIDPQPIYLHITTHGGGIHAAFSAVDCISQLSLPVYTVADGFVASAGTLITLAGEKRYITANAYMLIHELRSGVWGKMTSIDEEYLNLKKVMDHITGYYMKRTNITKKSLEKVLTKDIIWNAEECIEKGVVDEIYKK